MTSHFPSGRPLFSLLEDTFVGDTEDGRLTVHGRWGVVELEDSSPLVREALHRMGLGPVSLENIPMLYEDFATWRQSGRFGARWLRLWRTLDLLGGCMVPSLGLHDGAGPILSLVAVVPDVLFRCPHVGDAEPIGVRPGTTVRHVDDDELLECPGLPYTVALHRAPATGIARALMAGPTTIAQVTGGLGVRGEVVSDVVAYLASAGFVHVAETGRTDRTSTGPR
ncbi:MAG: hypothetical protein ABWY11_03225 [Umezawaea sp.]